MGEKDDQTSKQIADDLIDEIGNILPALASEDEVPHLDEKDVHLYLNQFYLLELIDLRLPSDEEERWQFIQDQFRTVLSAAYYHGLSVVTVINGDGGSATLYLGFQTAENTSKELFPQMLEGILPGLTLVRHDTLQIPNLLTGKTCGGLIAGIPTLRADNERQRFDLSSIIHALRNEAFTLIVISRPVDKNLLAEDFRRMLDARDQCHRHARQHISHQEGTTTTRGRSKATGGHLGLVIAQVTTTKSASNSEARQQILSLSYEQLDGLAAELEEVADHHLQRLKRASNVGYWETTIAYATAREEARDILAGAFAAQLSKPSELAIPTKIIKTEPKYLPLPRNLLDNEATSKSFSSRITSEELALISAPPAASVPGFEVRIIPRLGLTDLGVSSSEKRVTIGLIADHGKPLKACSFSLGEEDLARHLFVCGLTGSGKTTTVKEVLRSASQAFKQEEKQLPFLVMESVKRDYRQLLADAPFSSTLRVYTIGDATLAPLQFNPFFVFPGVPVISHIDLLKALFLASFSFYGPMAAILEKSLTRIYQMRGWDLTRSQHPYLHSETGQPLAEKFYSEEGLHCFPTLSDLKDEVDTYVKRELEYSIELSGNIRTAIIVRLERLCAGAKGLMFNTHRAFPIKHILSQPTIFELEALSDDEDKAFFLGLVLTFISEYRRLRNPSIEPYHPTPGQVQHILVIEEAHRLLTNVSQERFSELLGNPKGKAVETFCNLIAEMRALGQGIVVVEQIPSKIAQDVIKNTGSKVVHRLVSRDDQTLIASTIGLSEEEVSYLSQLKTGNALCHKEGMERAAEVVLKPPGAHIPISNAKIRRQRDEIKDAQLDLAEFIEVVGQAGKKVAFVLFNSLLVAKPGTENGLIEKAFQDLQQRIAHSFFHHRFSQDVAQLFLKTVILDLYTKGRYKTEGTFPEHFAATIDDLLLGKGMQALQRLQEAVSIHHKISAEETVCRVVSTVLLNMARQSGDKATEENMTLWARSCFVEEEPLLLNKIYTLTRNQLGGGHV